MPMDSRQLVTKKSRAKSCTLCRQVKVSAANGIEVRRRPNDFSFDAMFAKNILLHARDAKPIIRNVRWTPLSRELRPEGMYLMNSQSFPLFDRAGMGTNDCWVCRGSHTFSLAVEISFSHYTRMDCWPIGWFHTQDVILRNEIRFLVLLNMARLQKNGWIYILLISNPRTVAGSSATLNLKMTLFTTYFPSKMKFLTA